MTDLVDYAENIIIDALFRNSNISRPATWFIALSTSTPTDAGGNVTEPGDANYARMELDTGAASEWSDPGAGSSVNNTAELAWPAADTGFGTITHVVFFDAITGGNAWFWTALDSSVTVNAGEVFRFVAAALEVAFD